MNVTGSPKNFSCTLTTTATKEVFWRIWTDVNNWPAFDTPLKEAKLEGDMRAGAKGNLVTQQGQRSSFTITECKAMQSYAFATQLPACKLIVRRYFEDKDTLTFTHNVYFEGPLAFLFSALLGRSFMKALEPVMQNLKRIAEDAS